MNRVPAVLASGRLDASVFFARMRCSVRSERAWRPSSGGVASMTNTDFFNAVLAYFQARAPRRQRRESGGTLNRVWLLLASGFLCMGCGAFGTGRAATPPPVSCGLEGNFIPTNAIARIGTGTCTPPSSGCTTYTATVEVADFPLSCAQFSNQIEPSYSVQHASKFLSLPLYGFQKEPANWEWTGPTVFTLSQLAEWNGAIASQLGPGYPTDPLPCDEVSLIYVASSGTVDVTAVSAASITLTYNLSATDEYGDTELFMGTVTASACP